MANITFVCSKVCGGKTFYSKLLADNIDNCLFVEVSDIVKTVLNKQKREDLLNKPELDKQIIKQLKLLSNKNINMVVSGARQVSILKQFPQSTLIWIETHKNVRFKRYMNRVEDTLKDHNRNLENFNKIEMEDDKLGLSKVKQYIFERN